MTLLWSWFFLGLIVAFVVLVLVTAATNVWWMMPSVPTPLSLVRRMVAMARLNSGDRVYDLGAGDARTIIEAVRACPGVRATGYEVAPGIWLIGRLRLLLSRVRADLRFASFMSKDLSDADVIFLYLSPEFMVTLREKFASELRPGTRIISHAFTFKNRVPDAVESVPALLGGTSKIYLYVWRGTEEVASQLLS